MSGNIRLRVQQLPGDRYMLVFDRVPAAEVVPETWKVLGDFAREHFDGCVGVYASAEEMDLG